MVIPLGFTVDHDQNPYLEPRLLRGRITELEAELAKLCEAHEKAGHLAAIIDSADDAIISKTLSGVVQTWNAGAEQLYGYSASEMIGREIAVLLPPDRPDEENIILDRLSRGERVNHFDTIRRRKDGSL